MGGVPLTPDKKIPDVTEGWYSLTVQRDKIAEITGIDARCDLSGLSKRLEIVCEKADNAIKCESLPTLSAPSAPTLSSQIVQVTAALGTVKQTESPYAEARRLLEVTDHGTLPLMSPLQSFLPCKQIPRQYLGSEILN